MFAPWLRRGKPPLYPALSTRGGGDGKDFHEKLSPPLSKIFPLIESSGLVITVSLECEFYSGYKNVYIQSATLNAQPWTRNWVDHAF
jgi:hypothetical protein